MPRAILPCTFEVITYRETIPEGYENYTGPVMDPAEQDFYVALCHPPYIRPKTDRELAASEAIPGSARHRIKRNIEKTHRWETK